MQNPKQKKITLVFILLVAFDIVGLIINIEWLHFIVKPLLIPTLIVLLRYSSNTIPSKILISTGLLFSWFGDIFLLVDYKNDLFFILGLGCFLTTHIFYILYFLRVRSLSTSLLKKYPILLAIVLSYGITLVWQLYPKLGDLRLPVIIYAAVICFMLLSSLHIFLKVNNKAAWLYLLGATAFVLSDSLLAINKFQQSFAYAGVFIMLTYCAAQYLIVRGFIEQKK